MSFFRRFKISTRLVTMSVTLIVFTIIMCIIGSLNIVAINDRTNIVFDKEVVSLTYLQSIKESFLNVGSSLRDIAIGNGINLHSKEELESKIHTIQSHYMDMADDVINFTNNLSKYEGTESDIESVKKIEHLIENDYRAVVNSVILNARAGASLEEISEILSTGSTTIASLEKLIDDVYQKNSDQIRLTKKISNDTVASTIITMVLLNIIILLASIFMGQIINRSISQPIKKLLTVASKVTEGDFDVQTESNYKDEVGELTGSFTMLIGTIRELIFEMEHMAKRQENGDIDAVIDELKFTGSYRKVAQGINKMMTGLVKDVLFITECLTEFGKGNFNADIPQFPDKKAILNEGINGLRSNLTIVSKEINTLVSFATSGNLNKRADFSKYSGDWANIIIGLNDLLEAIVTPINEASSALKEFSEGNLNACMEGDYKGDFATIKQSINMTVSTIASYMAEIDQVLDTLVNQKDFNIGIKREYIGDFVTIKESINKIIDTFNNIISQMNKASFEVSEGAKEITDSNLALSEGSVTQSNMVDKLNSEIEILEKQTIYNAKNAEKANNFTIAVNESVNTANKEMEKMLKAMNEINNASLDISKIIKVIDDISDQTNLLSINASVEAARAGVHGKGFSVVADEVRRLAIRSKKSAEQTTNIINTTLKKVNDGSDMANKTAQALSEIVNKIDSISKLIFEINSSSETQAENIIQVNEDIGNILQVTKDAKISSEATLLHSEKLLKQSDSLKTLVEEFNLRSSTRKRA